MSGHGGGKISIWPGSCILRAGKALYGTTAVEIEVSLHAAAASFA